MIVDVVAQELFSGVRGALAVWLTMVFLVVLACAIASAPTWRDQLRARRARRARVSRHALADQATVTTQVLTVAPAVDGPAAQAVELRRYAEEVAVAASHAE